MLTETNGELIYCAAFGLLIATFEIALVTMWKLGNILGHQQVVLVLKQEVNPRVEYKVIS